MKTLTAWLVLLLATLSLNSVSLARGNSDEVILQKFIDELVKQLEPKLKAANFADWNANATGDKKFYNQSSALELEINALYSDKANYAYLKDLRSTNVITDPRLRRQLDILYFSFLRNQVNPELQKKIVQKQSAIAEKFNTFRGKIEGHEVTDGNIAGILKNERDPQKRRQAWEASKQVGRMAAPLIIELAKLRNQAAREMGFDNYYVMKIVTDEQDTTEVSAIFEQLKIITDAPFRQSKQELDTFLAQKFGIRVDDLQPWHYANPFFQEVTEFGEINLDSLFSRKDVVALAQFFYAGMGMPVDDILKNSDLYPRPGKYQHAYCTDMDRKGDVRTMCNVLPNQEWMGTLLHELGHGVYSKYIARDLPFLLRNDAHSFLTEAIAELMGRQVSNPDWLQSMTGIDDAEKEQYHTNLRRNFRLSQLAFCRWTLVMEHFEKALYENPDQDLDKLWWDLVEEFQLVKRPEGRHEPDWAAKIHIAQYPCMYHNYMLGEMVASQLTAAIAGLVGQKDSFEISFAGKPEVGDFLKTKIFQPGASLRWDDLLKFATGEKLTAAYFAREFTGK
jgi:peptidyl-dipeptidase A